MKQEVTNFARFYGVFNKIPYGGDREDLKKEMVSRATLGRTESLREVTRREYDDLCDGLERCFPAANKQHTELGASQQGVGWLNSKVYFERKSWRSVCLKLMQQLGIDTTDWVRVNAFCQDGRIAGKVFKELSIEELEVLSRKLRSIKRKGGLRELPAGEAAGTAARAAGSAAGAAGSAAGAAGSVAKIIPLP